MKGNRKRARFNTKRKKVKFKKIKKQNKKKKQKILKNKKIKERINIKTNNRNLQMKQLKKLIQ